MASNVLVIGGCGYIGSHVVKTLLERDYGVVILDNLETGYLGARAAVEKITGKSVGFFQGDIRDREQVDQCFREHKIDAVIHFAAYKNAGESVTKIAKYFENNVQGLLHVLEAMQAADVTKIVFSSSCSVYGTPAQCPVDESCPTQPESPYGESKLVGEMLLRDYSALGRLQAAALRYFNAAGADPSGHVGEDPSISLNLIPIAMKALRENREVEVFGDDYDTPDGTCIRDYIHVTDLAEAHVRALEHLSPKDPYTVWNLGTGTGSSVHEVLKEIGAQVGREVPHVITARRAGDPTAVFADPTKAQHGLGWTAQRGLAEIIADVLRWQDTHPQGYGS